jgi:hypothetical protein
MHHSLHSHVNLEALEKEARKLLHDIKRKDVAAVQRLELLDGIVSSRLADVHYLIARRYGFSSWKQLKERLVLGRTKT